MKGYSKCLLLMGALLALEPFIVSAGIPTQVSYTGSGTIVQIPFYGYSDSGNCATSCLQEAIGGAYHDGATFSSTVANYTNFACTQGGSSQAFGFGIQNAVAVLTCPGAITGNSVTLTYSSSQSTSYAYFYYPSAESVYQVTSGPTTIPSSNFVPNSGSLTTCMAPCVYVNAASHYAKAKLANPSNVAFYVQSNGAATTTAQGAPGGVGGGVPSSSGGNCGPNTTLQFNTTLGLYECVGTNGIVYQAPTTGNPIQIPEGLAILGALMAITVGYVYSRRGQKDLGIHTGPTRSPNVTKSGKSRNPNANRSGKQRSPTGKRKTD